MAMADSINSFKSRLDKFWLLHDFVYDYRAQPLTSGSTHKLGFHMIGVIYTGSCVIRKAFSNYRKKRLSSLLPMVIIGLTWPESSGSVE